jgi:putative Holliday junction resolvase
MRALGLDVGDKRIGVAVSDTICMTANGLKTIDSNTSISELKKIIADYGDEIATIVVGMPKMMDGTIGVQGEKVLEYVEKLKTAIPLPVLLWDERLSTVAADRALLETGIKGKRRKGLRDQVAATVILQNYLDSRV